VGVEKLHFRQNSENLGDRKCLGKPRTSFVGHPSAKFFSHFLMSEFFNSHGILRQSTQVMRVTATSAGADNAQRDG
jgi:hypothetical protein